MRESKYLYQNKEQLASFIDDHVDTSKGDVLVQIYAVCDKAVTHEIVEVIRTKVSNSCIIGAETSNSILGDLQNETLIVFTQFKRCKLKLWQAFVEDGDYCKAGRGFAKHMNFMNAKHMYNFVAASLDETEAFVDGITEVISDVVLLGGCTEEGRYIIAGEQIMDSGIAAVMLIDVQYGMTAEFISGIKPFTSPFVVTKVKDYVIEELNHIPVVQAIAECLGVQEEEVVEEIGIHFPFVMADGVVKRTYSYKQENGGVRTSGKLKAGSMVSLGFYDTLYAILNCKRILRKIGYSSVEQLMVFSTNARRYVMREAIQWETEAFSVDQKVYGAVLAGVYVHSDACVRVLGNATTVIGMAENLGQSWNVNIEGINELGKKSTNYLYDISVPSESLSEKLTIMNKKILIENMNKGDKINDRNDAVYHIDPFTGLQNQLKLEYQLKYFGGEGLALIQIRNFDEKYAFYGLNVGNQITLKLAEYLNQYVIEHGYQLYCISKSQFALLECYVVNLEQFIVDVKKLQRDIDKECFLIDDLEVFFEVNICTVRERNDLLEKANLAMEYMNENAIKYMEYDEGLRIEEIASNNIKVIKMIRDAIKDDRIVPYYQAIVNNTTCQVEKYECLVRMLEEDTERPIPPVMFLEVAKKSNLYFDITRIMLEKSFDKFRDLEYEFSFNVIVDDILDSDISELILEKIRTFPKPQNVILELVESDEIENLAKVEQFFTKIKAYGAKIAIDDFGTGYSNLKYLIDLNVDIIKIDGSIVKEIVYDRACWVVTRTILNLAEFLGQKVVAEYVENLEIYNVLYDMGVDHSQGYYFAKPERDILPQ